MRITLTVTDGPHKGLEFNFARHDTFLVGRSRHAHFQLPAKDRYFSRIHFMVEVNPPQCRLVDMGSHNGTFVNGNKVLAADLNDGDQIRAGHTLLRLSLAKEANEAEPPTLCSDDAPAISAPLALPVDLVRGYRLENIIGQGNMGVVYRARRLADESFVALKVILQPGANQPDQIDAFLKEARALISLDHPNIVRFLEMTAVPRAIVLVSDHVAGTDAATLLRDLGPLPVPRAAHIIAQVLQALEYGHARGMIHRDIKPTNILVTGGEGKETAWLTDYGLARVYQSSPLSGLTLTRDIVASAPYMPPELITNYREPTLFSDQYAAAATLYTLLTGQPVYDFPKEMHRQLSLLLRQQPIPIRHRRPDLSEAIALVIHKALHRNPSHRFSNVTAFRAALVKAALPDSN